MTREFRRKKATQRAPEEPRFNQYLLVKIGTAICGGLGLFFVSMPFWTSSQLVVVGGEYVAADEEELTSILEELRATWDPRARARILESVGGQKKFVGHLHRILRQPEHPFMEQAVELAGAFDAPELHPVIAKLAKHAGAQVRARAILVADRFVPWPPDEIAEFLEDITPVRIAALNIVPDRPDAPWPEICGLLLTDDVEVRRAAEQAFALIPPPAAVEALWAMVQLGSSDEEVAGLQAMSRTNLISEYEGAVTELLGRTGSDGALAALDFLATKNGPLDDSEAVWNLVMDVTADMQVRTKALHCLERTGSFDPEDVSQNVFVMESLLQYYAARCLILSERPEGVPLLLDLLDADERPTVLATRKLLAGITGLSPGARADEFREALTENRWSGSALPTPGVSF